MSFIPTPNCVRTAVQGHVAADEANITLWFSGVAPADLAALEALGDQVADWAATELVPILSNGYECDSVYLLAQDSNTAPFTTRTTGLPATGGQNSAIQSPQTAPVVKFSTANRGRSGRGRNYVPGVPLSGLSAPGVISAGFEASLLAAYGALNGYVVIAGFTHVVVSHFHNKVALSVGLAQAVLAYSITDRALGTQRRRRVGVGV